MIDIGFATQIRNFRLKQGMTQRQASAASGVSFSSYCVAEQGRCGWRVRYLLTRWMEDEPNPKEASRANKPVRRKPVPAMR